MDAVPKISIILGTIAVIFGMVEVLLAYRAARMQGLAKQLGWSYTAGNNHVWKLIFRQQHYKGDFRLHGSPMDAMWGAMNIIQGECGGKRVVILDSLLHFGMRTDRYVTFIGVKTETDPFSLRHGRERVTHSNGWFALYRMHFSVLSWSLSITRIEEHVSALGCERLSRAIHA